MTDTRRPGSRLEQALEIFLQAPPTTRAAADRMLQDHPDLRDVLAPMVCPPQADESGATGERVLGDFRLVREVGRGAMGVVYEAWQRSLDRRVAVKVLTRASLQSASAVARFRREAAAAARLRHANIVEIHGFGEVDGEHFFAMQFVDGRSLADCTADFRAPDAAVRVVAAVAAALVHAHEQGLVHRDVKPANVLIAGDGAVLLTDFGVARDELLPSLTHAGGFVGTLDYAAPEQLRGETVDGRADVWSLGVILHELLSGARPFSAATQQATLRNVLVAEPPSLRALAGVSTDLAAVVDRALQKDPSRRYATADALLTDLQALQRGDPVTARLPTRSERVARWARREPWRALAAAVLLVAVPAVAATAGYLFANSPRIRAAAAAEAQQDRDRRLAEAWFVRTEGRSEAALATLAPLPDGDAEVDFVRAWLHTDVGRVERALALLQPLPQPCMELTRRTITGKPPPLAELLKPADDPLDAFVRAALVFDLKLSRGRTPENRTAAALELVQQSMLLADRPRAGAAVMFAFLALETKERATMERANRLLATHFPSDPTANRLRAMLLSETDAEAALQWIAALPPDPAHAAYLASARGRAFDRLGDPEAAATAHRQALAIDPNRSSDWANLGAALRQRKQHPEAVAALQRAVELKPHTARFRNLLALATRDAGDLDAAEAMFAQITTDHPDYAPAPYNLGNLRLRRGDVAGAVAAQRLAVERDPTNVRHVANLGSALDRAGEPEEALEWSLRAAELAPRDLLPQYNVARLALQLGLERLALQAAQRARQNEPDNAFGFEILAEALLAQPTVDGAAALAAARATRDRRRGDTLADRLLLARALHAAGSREAAITEVEAARTVPAFASAEDQQEIEALLASLRGQ